MKLFPGTGCSLLVIMFGGGLPDAASAVSALKPAFLKQRMMIKCLVTFQDVATISIAIKTSILVSCFSYKLSSSFSRPVLVGTLHKVDNPLVQGLDDGGRGGE